MFSAKRSYYQLDKQKQANITTTLKQKQNLQKKKTNRQKAEQTNKQTKTITTRI